MLLWGSGFEHDLSHLFSPKEKFHKITYDGHTDDVPRIGFNMASHSLYTARLARCERVTVHMLPEDKKLQVYKTRAYKTGEIYRKKSNISNTKGKTVHLSIDLDCIVGFPSHPDYQPFKDCGFTLDEVREGVNGIVARNRVVRFDIGGLFLPRNKNLPIYGDENSPNPKANPQDRNVFQFGLDCYKVLLKEFLRVY